jgi:hypothetical protein
MPGMTARRNKMRGDPKKFLRRGKRVYVKKRGKWILKATAKTIENAKKMMRKLRSIGH